MRVMWEDLFFINIKSLSFQGVCEIDFSINLCLLVPVIFNSIHIYVWIYIILYYISAKSLHLCLTLCNPMDYSLPGSSVHGILQKRVLEWAVMPSPGILLTQGSKQCLLHLLQWQVGSLPLAPPGKPTYSTDICYSLFLSKFHVHIS